MTADELEALSRKILRSRKPNKELPQNPRLPLSQIELAWRDQIEEAFYLYLGQPVAHGPIDIIELDI